MIWLLALFILSAHALPDGVQAKVDEYLRTSKLSNSRTDMAGLKRRLDHVNFAVIGGQQDIEAFNESNDLVLKEIRRIRRDYEQPFMSEDELYSHFREHDLDDDLGEPPVVETMGSYYCRLETDPGFCQSQLKYFLSIHWNPAEAHETAFSEQKDSPTDSRKPDQ